MALYYYFLNPTRQPTATIPQEKLVNMFSPTINFSNLKNMANKRASPVVKPRLAEQKVVGNEMA